MSYLHSTQPLLHLPDSRYTWQRNAIPVDLTAYDRATDYFVHRAKACNFVCAVYSGRTVRYPGLSDLDILYVLDDNFLDIRRLKGLMRCSMPDDFRYVCTHDPFFIRSCELDRLFGFAPFFSLECLWQRESADAALDNTDETDLMFYLVETLIDSYPREMVEFLLLHMLDDRELIARLKGLGYCLGLMERVTGMDLESSGEWTAKIEELRSQFFEILPREREKTLLELTRQGLILSGRMINMFVDWMTGRWNLHVDGHLVADCARLAGIYREACVGGYGTVELHQREIYLERPAALGLFLREYAGGEGPFSNRIRTAIVDRLEVSGELPDDIRLCLAKRTRLRNDHQSWKDRLGLGLPGFMTFGYETKRRNMDMLARLRGSARRVLTRRREARIRKRLLQIVR